MAKITNNEIFGLIIVLVICQSLLLVSLFSPDIRGITGLSVAGSGIIELTVRNDAPLLTTIPDQQWKQDESITINLYDYFSDPENIPLQFSNSHISNIRIDISQSAGFAELTPDAGWIGIRHIIFYASDDPNSRASNNITLTIKSILPGKPPAPLDDGSVIGCYYRWGCQPWTGCLPEGVQKRSCLNLGNCPEDYKPPVVTRPCDYVRSLSSVSVAEQQPEEEKPSEVKPEEEIPAAVAIQPEKEVREKIIFDIADLLLLLALLFAILAVFIATSGRFYKR